VFIGYIALIYNFILLSSKNSEETGKAHEILVGKTDRKKALRRPRHRQVDVKMDLKETGWE
jgi:hypothetical protein